MIIIIYLINSDSKYPIKYLFCYSLIYIDNLILKEEVLIIDIKYNFISLDLIKTLFYLFFSQFMLSFISFESL